MDTSTSTTVTPRQVSPVTIPRSIWPGLMVVIAGSVLGDGALITAAHRGVSLVSEDRLSFPWDGPDAVTTTLVWGAAQILLTLGLVRFAQSIALQTRLGRSAGRLFVGGSMLYVLGHAVTLGVIDARMDEPGGLVVMACFGVGTVATAIGLLMAGRVLGRPGGWSRWRRHAPTALGAWMVVMIPLQFMPALLPLIVGVFAMATIALGAAMLEEERS